MSAHSAGSTWPCMLNASRAKEPRLSGAMPRRVQVLDELAVPGVDVGVRGPDLLQPLEILSAEAHLPQLAQDRRRHAVHGRAEVGDEAEPRRVDLGVGLPDLQHLRRVRADRRVDLPAERQVELLGDRQQPADQLGLGALDAHEREAERVRAAELGGGELVLLVGRHVAVAAAPHVEVAAERARHEPVPVEGVPPVARRTRRSPADRCGSSARRRSRCPGRCRQRRRRRADRAGRSGRRPTRWSASRASARA